MTNTNNTMLTKQLIEYIKNDCEQIDDLDIYMRYRERGDSDGIITTFWLCDYDNVRITIDSSNDEPLIYANDQLPLLVEFAKNDTFYEPIRREKAHAIELLQMLRDDEELSEHDLTRDDVAMVVECTNLDEDEARQLLIEYVSNGYSVDDFEESYNGVHDDDEDFTRQLLEDTGDIPADMPTYIHIDWTRTANDIMMDYFTVELNGDSYYFRNI